MSLRSCVSASLVVAGTLLCSCSEQNDAEREPLIPRLDTVFTLGNADFEDGWFGGVTDVVFRRDGGVIVLDAITPAIHAYDSVGDHLGMIGRQGQGPGEYRSPSELALLPGDSLVVWDAGNGRMTVYDRHGAAVRSWPGPVSSIVAGQGLVADRAGFLYLRAASSAIEPSSAGPSDQVVFKLTSTGEVVDTLLDPFPVAPPPRIGGPRGGVLPFWPTLSWTVTASGTVAVTRSAEYRILLLAADGDTVGDLTQDYTAPAVLADEASQWRAVYTDVLERMGLGGQWDGPDIPERKPAIRELVAGQDGSLLVVLHTESVEGAAEETGAPSPNGGRPQVTFREPPLVDTWTTQGELVRRLALSPGERVVEHRGRRYAVAHEGADGVPLLTILEVADQEDGSANGTWESDRSPR